jgi:glycosyltransferase involved in cell wall biosynthesis
VEALGASKPCVFSDIDPFVIPYEGVALFHHVDNVDQLVEQIVRFSNDSALREQYGHRGRKLVEQKYTLKKVAKQYATLYSDII